jgi:hypothetical protein
MSSFIKEYFQTSEENKKTNLANEPLMIVAIVILSIGILVSIYAFYYVYTTSKLPNRFPTGPRINKKNPIQSSIENGKVSLNFYNNASKLNRRPTKPNALNQYRRLNKYS